MNVNFFAYMSRMKLIKRWSLMRNIQQENIAEHSHQVAVIAHGLALAANKYFGAGLDIGRVVMLAVYHDSGEVLIGDLPTPVKYFNPEIKSSYGEIEDIAKRKLLSFLPRELSEDYEPLLFGEDGSREAKVVKAADKLSAYVKCLEEVAAGNMEFAKAKDSIGRELEQYRELPEVGWFLDNCVDGFARTLDELG